jgi:hypothetical protein
MLYGVVDSLLWLTLRPNPFCSAIHPSLETNLGKIFIIPTYKVLSILLLQILVFDSILFYTFYSHYKYSQDIYICNIIRCLFEMVVA